MKNAKTYFKFEEKLMKNLTKLMLATVISAPSVMAAGSIDPQNETDFAGSMPLTKGLFDIKIEAPMSSDSKSSEVNPKTIGDIVYDLYNSSICGKPFGYRHFLVGPDGITYEYTNSMEVKDLINVLPTESQLISAWKQCTLDGVFDKALCCGALLGTPAISHETHSKTPTIATTTVPSDDSITVNADFTTKTSDGSSDRKPAKNDFSKKWQMFEDQNGPVNIELELDGADPETLQLVLQLGEVTTKLYKLAEKQKARSDSR